MSRHPFGDYAEKFMASMRNVYSEETWRTKERRYRRIERDLIELKSKGKISTLSPTKMTPEDLRVHFTLHKSKVGPGDMGHEVAAFRRLLEHVGNSSVNICLAKYPELKPYNKRLRKSAMPEEMYREILARAKELDPDDEKLVRAYAMVLLFIRTGTRNNEMRMADVEDLNTSTWMFSIRHVKGENTYGLPREVPVHPEVRQIVSTYLRNREKWAAEKGMQDRALFLGTSGRLSGNGIRIIKNAVEKDLGIEFDLRMCRRTFGQYYLNDGLDIESTSVLMGHSTTRTTETAYARRRLDDAISEAMGTW